MYNKVGTLSYSRDPYEKIVPNTFNHQALLSVFKGRLLDARERDTAIENCELSIQDNPDTVECRLIVKMFCRHGRSRCFTTIESGP